ncbi:MAG: hydrogenase maturation protease [Planctomycetes bacterium]|nr:hydrogenase maturation protease [Planctomycetota bacterium]
MTARVRIVGCGRWSMSDDQAGLHVAERLAERLGDLKECACTATESPADVLTESDAPEVELLVVIDAARADPMHAPGGFTRIIYRDAKGARVSLPSSRQDTHTLGVATSLALAEHVGGLPDAVWVYVVFGSRFERGFSPGPEVERALPRLCGIIERDVRDWLGARPCMS